MKVTELTPADNVLALVSPAMFGQTLPEAGGLGDGLGEGLGVGEAIAAGIDNGTVHVWWFRLMSEKSAVMVAEIALAGKLAE